MSRITIKTTAFRPLLVTILALALCGATSGATVIGVVQGDDGKPVRCIVGVDIHDLATPGKITMDGTPATAGYSTVLSFDGTKKELSLGPLNIPAGHTWAVYFEAYPKNLSGKTDNTYYTSACYQALSVTSKGRTGFHLTLQQTAKGTGRIKGRVMKNGLPWARKSVRFWGGPGKTDTGFDASTSTDEEGYFTSNPLKTYYIDSNNVKYTDGVKYNTQVANITSNYIIGSPLVATNAVLNVGTINIPVGSDHTAPSIPASLKLVTRTLSTITISWGASTDNVKIFGYQIFRNNVKVYTTPRLKTTDKLQFLDTALKAGTAYTYNVKAYDGENNFSGLSAAFKTSTLTATAVDGQERSEGAVSTQAGYGVNFLSASMVLPNHSTGGMTDSISRPNIVWIFSDDHSFQTIGAYGGRLQALNPTPNIDRLAKEGMRFDRCYVANSICAPSRATLLTGKHSHMNGKYDNRVEFDHNQQQFQKILQTNGYQTVMVGKIHLNGKMQGFDYWDVLPGQGEYNNPAFISEKGKTISEGYVSDIITDKALDWLKNKRDPGKPFMLMIHQKAPHRPWTPAPQDMGRYEDVEIPEPANLFDDYATRTTAAHKQAMMIDKVMTMAGDLKVGPKAPAQFAARNKYYAENKPTGKELVKWKYQLYMKDYLRCIWSVDQSVGRVLQSLKDLGLDENTIVMYSSDQGFYMGEHGWFDKRFMYEESFRTPLLARWPGKIKPGSVNADLVQNIDFAETFLDLARAPIPGEMQGKSIVPLLNGATPKDWRTSLYYHYYEYPGMTDADMNTAATHSVRRHEGVANSRYKLIRFYGKDVPNGEEWEFYDLDRDPSEMNNLYGNPEYAAKVQEMKKELDRLRQQYQVPDDVLDKPVPAEKKPGSTVSEKSTSGDNSGFVVSGGDLSKSGDGYRLASGKSMGFALKPLPEKLREQRTLVFQTKIKTSASGASNGLICFGEGSNPEELVKCGIYAEPGELVVLYGKFGGPEQDIIRQKAGLSRKAEYDITVTVNLDSQTVRLDVNGQTLSAPLRRPMQKIGFYGVNCNKTETWFSDIIGDLFARTATGVELRKFVSLDGEFA